MTARTLFRNARLLDPASGLDGRGDLLVADGKIAGFAQRDGSDAPKVLVVNQALAAEFGLSAEEYGRVLEIMGRTPWASPFLR